MSAPPSVIIDGCAGPGGWSEGLRLLGLSDIGVEWDEAACLTRAAAGHATIRADVASIPLGHLAGLVQGVIFSPPCTAFSQAGKGAAMEVIDRLIAQIVAGDWTPIPGELPEVWLALEVGRWVEALSPRWLACELTPKALPVWEAYARWLSARGYSVWCGVLNAADFGVPQTRRRAFLMASLDRAVHPPVPTHDEAPQPTLFGPELASWITMAAALGWGRGERVGFPRRDDVGSSPDGYRERDWTSAEEPAPTLTEKARSWSRQAEPPVAWVDVRRGPRAGDEPGDVLGEGFDPNAEPAQTVTSRVDRWQLQPVEAEPILVNTGRDWKPGGSRDDAQTFDATAQPAPTIDGKGRWHLDRDPCRDGEELPLLQPGGSGYENPNRRLYDPAEEPAPTIAFGHDSSAWRWRDRRHDQSQSGEVDPDWPLERPATTIAGRGLVPDPGANANRFNGNAKSRNDGYRVEAHEAAVLQSFPVDYPWQGNRTKVFQQIGNAVPPRLAAAVIAALLGLPQP